MILVIILTVLVVAAIVATLVVSSRDGYRRSPLAGDRNLMA
jgi:hypothetical protein